MPKFLKRQKIKKLRKRFPRYMWLDGFGKILVIFVEKYCFTLVEKRAVGDFSTTIIFSQKPAYLNRLLVNFPF